MLCVRGSTAALGEQRLARVGAALQGIAAAKGQLRIGRAGAQPARQVALAALGRGSVRGWAPRHVRGEALVQGRRPATAAAAIAAAAAAPGRRHGLHNHAPAAGGGGGLLRAEARLLIIIVRAEVAAPPASASPSSPAPSTRAAVLTLRFRVRRSALPTPPSQVHCRRRFCVLAPWDKIGTIPPRCQ